MVVIKKSGKKVCILCFRISTNTESFSVEGASIEHELVPILTSDVGVYGKASLSCVKPCHYSIMVYLG